MELKRGLEKIFSPEFESFLSESIITLRFKKDGLWHSSPSPHYCSLGEEVEPKKLKIYDALKEEICEECTYGEYNVFLGSKEYRWVEKILDLREYLETRAEAHPGINAASVQQWIFEVQELEKRIIVMRRQLPEGEEFFNKLEIQREETLEKLKIVKPNAKSRAALEKRVLRSLVPRRMEPQLFDIDTTMSLIGIYPNRDLNEDHEQTNSVVQAIINAYSIRQDKAIVLHAPAYFHTYLASKLQCGGEIEHLVVATKAPEDMEACENASYIWDPEGDGPLASLHKAVNSGQALSG